MIRKAALKDIKYIHKILQDFGEKGELLPRPLSKLYDTVRNFSVYVDKQTNQIAGCCSLSICWEDLAEIRSLAVKNEYQYKNIGTLLVEEAIREAKNFEIKKVFTLTYRPGFFERFGFTVIDKSELPLKIWSDCILCVKFPNCDETAMLKTLVS